MDAGAYIDCLSDTFTFWLNPEAVAIDPELPDYWDLMSEEGIHWNMFDTGWIDSVELTLTQYGDPVEIPGTTPGLRSSWEYQENYHLRLHLPQALLLWAREGAVFRFTVDPDEVGPSGEELWEISRWSDVEGFDTPVEHTSWGRIKALFR
jgi:hypothetical protein